MYDAFVAYGLQYLLHKRRMKFYRKMYAAALLSVLDKGTMQSEKF